MVEETEEECNARMAKIRTDHREYYEKKKRKTRSVTPRVYQEYSEMKLTKGMLLTKEMLLPMMYSGEMKKLEKIPPRDEPTETDRVIMGALNLTTEELHMIVKQGSLKRMKKGYDIRSAEIGPADYDPSPFKSMDMVETITYDDCGRVAYEYHQAIRRSDVG